jgi:nicotinic acid mononucleotide adenylyltransferase
MENPGVPGVPDVPDVVFSFQGAFGYPTWGHYVSMREFAKQVLLDYPSEKILMLFMPTAASGAKPHLRLTQDLRIEILNRFCELLKSEVPFKDSNITFQASTIEYEIYENTTLSVNETPKTKNDSATIWTIKTLHDKYQTSTLLLGMGYDNMLQLPYWKFVNEYIKNIKKIYVVDRALTEEELGKTKEFIKNEIPFRFEDNIPSWYKPEINVNNLNFYKKIEKDKNGNDIETDKLLNINRVDLPEIKMIHVNIPATSSSMMRYYICLYIKDSNPEHFNKIKSLMFGPYASQNDDQLILDCINKLREMYNPDTPCKDDKYDEKYSELTLVGGRRRKSKRGRRSKQRRSKKSKRSRKSIRSKRK